MLRITPAKAKKIPVNFIIVKRSPTEMTRDTTIGNTTDILLAMVVTDIPAACEDLAMRKNIRMNMIPMNIDMGTQSNPARLPKVNFTGFKMNPRMDAKK